MEKILFHISEKKISRNIMFLIFYIKIYNLMVRKKFFNIYRYNDIKYSYIFII